MCGGIAFAAKRVSKEELGRYYSMQQVEEFMKNGVVKSFFWDPVPFLPVEKEGKTQLMLWGNRSEELKLPKTGWAKKESIDMGKWAYLHPESVKIPVERGYEKGVWFDVKSGGFKGVEVDRDGEKRVYMMTKPADKEYQELTGHNRQPVEN